MPAGWGECTAGNLCRCATFSNGMAGCQFGLHLARKLAIHWPFQTCKVSWAINRRCSRLRAIEEAAMNVESRILSPQAFSSNLLNRSGLERREATFLEQALPKAQILLISGNKCSVQITNELTHHLSWHTLDDLKQAGFHEAAGHLTYSSAGSSPLAVIPFLLGQEGKQWMFAADVASLHTHLKDLEFIELRGLLGSMPKEELAVAGHAIALSQWHASNPFCSRCGSPNKQVEAGGKLQCTANERHRFYPRTDPVAIMMVEDTSGNRALLGRPKKLRNGVLTCLSGFIEQGESIEEAVRREVLEEAGIRVGEVAILGSQPWPIGRGGSCELMIGCIGKALSDDLRMDEGEMDDVRWVQREDVRAAIEASSHSDAQYDSFNSKAAGLDFFVPPNWAIAHSLIKQWVQKSEPWFSKL